MKAKLNIGTRQSLLALWQSEHIAALLRGQYPECAVLLKKIVTRGDRILDAPLSKIGGKGLFTKEIESALLDGSIDLAVHSLKDMPTVLPEGLCLAAVTARENAGDAFVSHKYARFAELPAGASVGTSSLRRRAQLLAARPDLKIYDLRGNIDTRLRKLAEQKLDAIILAAAGLKRLGLQAHIREILPPALCLPAVGQGALAIECRSDDAQTRAMPAFLDDEAARLASAAERACLILAGGGCQAPGGVYAQVARGTVHIDALIASLDGSTVLRDSATGPAADAAALGMALGRKMLAQGGQAILSAIL